MAARCGGVGILMVLSVFVLSSFHHFTHQQENHTLVPSEGSHNTETRRWPSRLLQSSEFAQSQITSSLDNPLQIHGAQESTEQSIPEQEVSGVYNVINTTKSGIGINTGMDSFKVESGTVAKDYDNVYNSVGEDHAEYDTKESEEYVVYSDYKEESRDQIDSSPNDKGTHYPSTELSPQLSAESELYTYSPHIRSTPQASCNVSSIKSWKRGLITELQPRISANCKLLRSNDRHEISRVKADIASWTSSQSEKDWIDSLSDCEAVVKDFSNSFYNSPTEVDFPIAYVLVVYTNPRQMVRLIKALWRPQNLFCIHPDAKQSEEFIGVFRTLAKCLDNVFLPRKLDKVYYQHHSIMDSQMNCYEELMTYPSTRWKYAVNLCGRELPLKTNREIVESLVTLKGHSAIKTGRVHTDSQSYLARDRFKWKVEEDYHKGKLTYTHKKLKKPPIPIYKSTNFIAASRQFVNFFLTDKRAIEFRNYLKVVKIPEEEFYASLIHLPGVPGGLPPPRVALPTIDRYIWMSRKKQTRVKKESCEGRMVHFVCILGVGDLDQIFHLGVNTRTPVLFFNKYFMEEDHVVMDCMEERLIQQNMKEHAKDCLYHH